eukprot:3863052-Alexandrium_andersonii.AAC.1
MPVLIGPADAPPAPIMLQQPPQNQQAQAGALPGDRPEAETAALAAATNAALAAAENYADEF